MISLDHVSDLPMIAGSSLPLLARVDLSIPKGRYALLSSSPELHRPIIDVLARLRPPTSGIVHHQGLVSWPLGRQGFVRGKNSGESMIKLVSSLYGLDWRVCSDIVADLVTNPELLARPMEHWPLYMRQEFSLALALAPDFDVYVIDGSLPTEPCRFTRLWLALFEERLVGRTLILSTYRQNQMADFCTKGLIYERSSLRIADNLDECIRRFPARRSRTESSDVGEVASFDIYGAGNVGF